MTTTRSSSGLTLVSEIIAQTGALAEGHYVHGKRHTGQWLAVERFYTKPQHMTNIYRLLATRLHPYQPEAVLGLAPDGIALAYAMGAAVAPHLEGGQARDFVSVYMDEQFRFPFGYGELLRGRKVAIVQHIIASGGTVGRMAQIVEGLGGTVTVVGAVIDRATHKANLPEGVPIETLCDYTLDDWPAERCPLCVRRVPLSVLPSAA